MKKPEVTKYYVARDKSGAVYLYNNKPVKLEEEGFWQVDGKLSNHNLMLRLDGAFSIGDNGHIMPHWEDDEPMLVALALIPYESIKPELVKTRILTR